MVAGNGLVPQALRYGAVGLVVLAMDFAVYSAVLWWMPGQIVPANLSGKIGGAALGFILHRSVTFRWQQRDAALRQFFAYLCVLGFNMLLSSLLLWLTVDHWGANPYTAKLAIEVIVIGSAFLLSRFWVYRPS